MSASNGQLLRQTGTKLSPAARVFVATLTPAQRDLIRDDLDHLERHPDPAGDLSGLRQSLRLAQTPAMVRDRLVKRARQLIDARSRRVA